MKHVYHLAEADLTTPSVVTIGVFDGVHRGHQYLIQQLVAKARASDRMAVVLTFFPHPDVVLRGLTGRYYLTTPEQRAEELGKLGVDLVVTHPFNDDIRQVRAAHFVDQLAQHLHLSELWIGQDFALGYKREGNVAFLQTQGDEKGFTVNTIELLETDHHVISSTAIREALQNGDIEAATEGLGRPYAVAGEVVHGDQRGRTIGFPTANVAVWEQQVIPANGVYAGWTQVSGERFMTVTNVGVRPTFDGKTVTIEAHLLDFDRDLYGQRISVSFAKRLRGEQKFSGIDALIAQIKADAEAGRAYLTI